MPKLAWGKVSKVSGDDKSKVIVLHSGLGSLRLFCNEDNYDEVMGYVNNQVNSERYVS